MSTTTRILTRGALAALLLSSSAAAQGIPGGEPRLGPSTATGEPRFQGGLSAIVGQPRGAFRRYVDDGFGVGGHALYRLDRQGAFAVRLDGGYLNYGRETLRIPFGTRPGGGRVGLDLTTTNDIVWLGLGPQVMAPRGPVRPYVNGTAGISYFATTSSVSGRDDLDAFAHDTNYDDTQFSWGAGAGVLVPVWHNRRSLVLMDLGARYHDNGRNVRYLSEGGIRDLPNGDVQLDVIRSRADLITWHLGVSVGAR
jgi:opacity protein-like surface antigen